jgi:hypothetical protein
MVGFGVGFNPIGWITTGWIPIGFGVGPGMVKKGIGVGLEEGIGIFLTVGFGVGFRVGFRVGFLVGDGSPGWLQPADGHAPCTDARQARQARIRTVMRRTDMAMNCFGLFVFENEKK